MYGHRYFKALMGVIATASLFLASCGKEKADITKADLTQISQSDCLLNSKGAIADGRDSVSITVTDGEIKIEHYNNLVYCGHENLRISCTVEENIIEVREVDFGAMTDCNCTINNFFTIGDVPSGEYTFVLYSCKDLNDGQGTHCTEIFRKNINV